MVTTHLEELYHLIDFVLVWLFLLLIFPLHSIPGLCYKVICRYIIGTCCR